MPQPPEEAVALVAAGVSSVSFFAVLWTFAACLWRCRCALRPKCAPFACKWNAFGAQLYPFRPSETATFAVVLCPFCVLPFVVDGIEVYMWALKYAILLQCIAEISNSSTNGVGFSAFMRNFAMHQDFI